MNFVDPAVEFIKSYAFKIPLEAFVMLGAFVEEVLAPIPSPFVMTSAGTIAVARGLAFSFVIIGAYNFGLNVDFLVLATITTLILFLASYLFSRIEI